MRIVIRVDASPQMGTGHVHRTVALAEALRSLGATICFVTRPLGVDTMALLGAYRCLTLRAPTQPVSFEKAATHAEWAGVGEMVDARETIEALRQEATPDWIIVDSYAFGATWHQALRLATGAAIAVVDDLADRPLDADLIIDHNLGAEDSAKYAMAAPGAPVLGGPRFALLSPVYTRAARYEPNESVRSVGVFMGGVDAVGATMVVLDAMADQGLPVEVATTSANPHLSRLRMQPGIKLTIDQPDLAAFFGRHDLQIGAGGGASWERCCVGVPTLLIAVADNQRASIPGLVATGAVATADFAIAAIRDAALALIADPVRRAALAARSRALVDGRGALRAALRLMRDGLVVRRATDLDAQLLFDWRNDPATRRMSRDDRPIAWETHRAWLHRVLADPARTLLIANIGAVPVGVIRFDPIFEGAVEVSLYLDPGLHGLGLGQRMLRAGEAMLPALDIHAEVMEGNGVSAQLFSRAGYSPDGAGRWIKAARRAYDEGAS